MEKIPTAEEFLRMQGCREGDGEWDLVRTTDLILFTEMHVEAALKEAVKCLPYDDKMNQSLLDSRAILNSYPLNKIK